jgi:hypothetical protein
MSRCQGRPAGPAGAPKGLDAGALEPYAQPTINVVGSPRLPTLLPHHAFAPRQAIAAVGDHVGMRRLRFLGRVVVSGLRWAKELADHAILLLGVLLLATGIAVGGVLLHRAAWLLGLFGGLSLLVVLGEGAYRTWDEADRHAETARVGLAEENASDTTARRLAAFAREGRGIQKELPPASAGPSEWNEARRTMASILDHWIASVESEIRRNAEDLMPRWRAEVPTHYADGLAWASAANIHELLNGVLARLDELIECLNSERGKA